MSCRSFAFSKWLENLNATRLPMLSMLDTIKQAVSLLAEDAWRSLSGLPAFLAAGTSLVLVSSRSQAEPKPVVSVESPRMPEPTRPGTHWHRISNLIESRVDAAHRAVRMQADARTQIDAAEFTLAQILQDLRTLVPVQANVSPLIVPPRPAYKPRPALAA